MNGFVLYLIVLAVAVIAVLPSILLDKSFMSIKQVTYSLLSLIVVFILLGLIIVAGGECNISQLFNFNAQCGYHSLIPPKTINALLLIIPFVFIILVLSLLNNMLNNKKNALTSSSSGTDNP